MDVKQVLSDAWDAVEDSGVPEKLHAVAFEQAVRLIAGPMPTALVPHTRTSTEGASAKFSGSRSAQTSNAKEESDRESIIDTDEFFKKFAAESAIDEEKLREVYMVKGGEVKLGLTKRVLGDTEAARNRAVALLTVAPGWYVDGRQELLFQRIREVARSMGYEPSRNMSSHLDSVPGTLPVGTKNDKAIRVQNAKFDTPFCELIERLVAG